MQCLDAVLYHKVYAYGVVHVCESNSVLVICDEGVCDTVYSVCLPTVGIAVVSCYLYSLKTTTSEVN